MDTPNPGQGPVPGWYPDPYGQPGQRWWDGTQWTDQVSGGAPGAAGAAASGDRSLAQLVHILGLLTGFLGPLILWLIKRDEDPFASQHAVEALNFQITVAIAAFVSGLLILLIIGIVLLPAVVIVDIIFSIQQTLKAGQGEPARYPISIRLVS